MTLTDAMARITEIRSLVDPQGTPSASASPSTASTAVQAASFQQLLAATSDGTTSTTTPSGLSSSALLTSALQNAGATGATGVAGVAGTVATGGVTAPAAGTPAQRLLAAAQAEVGQAEQPPGSNDSPRIAEYRTATSGSGVGPWCAYFTSWAAQQAGIPIGEAGQGFGAVASVSAWAQRTGRWIPEGTGTPQPGDLIVWGSRHIGIVESVDPDGSVHTIEGNSSNAVTRRNYDASGGGATGYVRLG